MDIGKIEAKTDGVSDRKTASSTCESDSKQMKAVISNEMTNLAGKVAKLIPMVNFHYSKIINANAKKNEILEHVKNYQENAERVPLNDIMVDCEFLVGRIETSQIDDYAKMLGYQLGWNEKHTKVVNLKEI